MTNVPGVKKLPKTNWTKLEPEIIKTCKELESKGFSEPTIRAIYYVLGSAGKIPLTSTGYKLLDRRIVKMRREGTIPWGFFAVKRGTSIGNNMVIGIDGLVQVRDLEMKVPEESTVAFLVNRLKKASEEYVLPRWWGQPEYVELWIEKDGLLGALHSWVADMGVTVRAPQGYGAWEFVNQNVERIKMLMDQRAVEPGHVHIIYLGDLDPSGKDIPRFARQEMLTHFGLEVDFQELALNVEQVKQYQLPEIPDSADVRAKIARDVRLKWYLENYGEVFCELDAFFSLQTQAARDLVRRAVEELYDVKFEKARDEEQASSRKNIEDLVGKAVRFKKTKARKRDETDAS